MSNDVYKAKPHPLSILRHSGQNTVVSKLEKKLK